MTEVKFENQNYNSSYQNSDQNTPSMTRFLVRVGIIEKESQAPYVLLIISLIAISLTVIIIINTFGNKELPPIQQSVTSGYNNN